MNSTQTFNSARTGSSDNLDSIEIATTTRFGPGDPSSSQAPASRAGRRFGRSALLVGAVMLAMFATACFPTGPVSEWVKDANGDGVISEAEIDAQRKVIVDQVVAAVAENRRRVQLHPVLTCIRHHESDRGAYPHTNGYAAKNSRSSASGAYQFINGTWRSVSAKAGFPGYSTARHAPWYVQDAVAMWVINHQGRSAWRGSGC